MVLTIKVVYDIIHSIPVDATGAEKKSVYINQFGDHIKKLSSVYVYNKVDHFSWQFNRKFNDALICIKKKRGGSGKDYSVPPKTFYPNPVVGIELKGFECSICYYKFKTKNLFNLHMNIEKQRVNRFHDQCLARVWRHPSFKRYLCEPALIPGVIQHNEYENFVLSLKQTDKIVKEIEWRSLCISLMYTTNRKKHIEIENTKLAVYGLSNNTQMLKLTQVKISW